MEDEINGRRTTSIEDYLIGRWFQGGRMKASMEENLNGRRPQWKTTSIEELLTISSNKTIFCLATFCFIFNLSLC